MLVLLESLITPGAICAEMMLFCVRAKGKEKLRKKRELKTSGYEEEVGVRPSGILKSWKLLHKRKAQQ